MINDIAHARSYARDLKRQLKPFGIGHLAAHDMAARTIGLRDWRTLSTKHVPSASRDEIGARLRQEIGYIQGADADAIVAALLPPAGATNASDASDAAPEPRHPHYDNGKPKENPLDLLHAFDGKQLDNVYHAILMDHRGHGPVWTRRMEECLKQGYFPRPAIEDLLDDCDHRLRVDRIGMNLDQLMGRLGYPWVNMTIRPLANATSAMMFKAISPADLAGLLITLERMGFQVPAEPLVERLLPDVKRRNGLTPSELSVFWYLREKDRFHMRFVAEDVNEHGIYDEGRLANRYKYDAEVVGDQVGCLNIYGSKYRRRKSEW